MERSRALIVRLYSAVRDRRRHNKPHALYGRAFSGNIDSGKCGNIADCRLDAQRGFQTLADTVIFFSLVGRGNDYEKTNYA